MKLTKLSAAWLPEWTQAMPAAQQVLLGVFARSAQVARGLVRRRGRFAVPLTRDSTNGSRSCNAVLSPVFDRPEGGTGESVLLD